MVYMATQGISWEPAVLWNLILFPQEVKGLLEECAQEESNYHYVNCMKRVRAQTVHCEMKW